jgi:hypothetical protein
MMRDKPTFDILGLVGKRQEKRRLIDSEEDFDAVIQLMLDTHPDFFVLPTNPWTLH